MAFAATQIWECRSDGDNTNGGGFDPTSGVPGTDFSQQAAAAKTYTDLVIDAVTNTDCTSALLPFTAAHVGNTINITGGVGFTVQRVQVLSVTAGVARCDKSLGTLGSVGGAGKLGGALLDPETIDLDLVAGNTIYVREGTYTKTSTRTFTADGTKADLIRMIGYPAVGPRTDTDCTEATMPVFTTATNSIAKISQNASSYFVFRNIKVTDTAATRGLGFAAITGSSVDGLFLNCICDGCLSGFENTNGLLGRATYVGCTVRNCTSATGAGFLQNTSSTLQAMFVNCLAHDNAGDGWAIGATTATAGNVVLRNCIADTNARDGVRVGPTTGGGSTLRVENCSFYNNLNGIHSLLTTGIVNTTLLSNIFYGNATTGILVDTASVTAAWVQLSNAFGGNGTNRTNLAAGYGDITLTASPWLDAAGGNFGLNGVTGGGLLLRAVGYPTVIGVLGAGTSQNGDIGASGGIRSGAGLIMGG